MIFSPRPWLRKHTAQTQQTCRLLAACGLAGGGTALLGVPESYWALITAVTVMQPDLSHTFSAGRDRVIATLIGAAVGFPLIALHERGLPMLPLFAAGLVPLAIVTASWPNLRLAGTTLIVVFLIPATGDPYARPLLRVADILLGVVACLVVSFLVFPSDAKSPWGFLTRSRNQADGGGARRPPLGE
jgi:uncharacterized membrane protein YccC